MEACLPTELSWHQDTWVLEPWLAGGLGRLGKPLAGEAGDQSGPGLVRALSGRVGGVQDGQGSPLQTSQMSLWDLSFPPSCGSGFPQSSG